LQGRGKPPAIPRSKSTSQAESKPDGQTTGPREKTTKNKKIAQRNTTKVRIVKKLTASSG
jgi:hypothetical protein